AYVPWQHLSQIYENLEEAFQVGTIFPELDKPFTGRRVIS
ncbi:MAG: spore coat associated protein CotJA, partial [Lachnospiraceae bacterium]|nr:spore coat associated protein CotJA [Lachnospiraceae bacterium]